MAAHQTGSLGASCSGVALFDALSKKYFLDIGFFV